MNDPEKVNYNAFHDDESNEPPQGGGNLKISDSQSRYKTPAAKSTTEDFDTQVADIKSQEIEIKNRIADAATKYRAFIKDKTVSENKSPIKESLEKEVIKELSDVGLFLNNDSTRPEGIGSIGLCNLLLQVNLQQRDQINDLVYEVVKLKRVIERLVANTSSEPHSNE